MEEIWLKNTSVSNKMITGFIFCNLQDSLPNDTEIVSDNIESLFVHSFVLDVEAFGFEACFFEVLEGSD